ncbi:hypothetical protein UM93_07935 [Psychromicrobium lacuslunae]|uniref:HTH tetR-type domain-containing protein n=2 Tax=Psychromicrobium lacuslunae TaxID=1618207 RepID=A0A0D4BZ95_9MICC|nr:hypothetical protein UM93_07935 [Psychromicrobium lacuslunae]
MTSAELIARAVIKVGFQDLTMAKVANSLGMKHSSLYRHVASREELISMAVDLMILESPAVTPAQDWRGHLEQLTDAVWEQFERFPGLASEVAALPEPPAGLLWVFASSAEILVSFGFSAERAMMVTDLLCDMTVSSYLNATQPVRAKADRAAEIKAKYRSLREVRPDVQLPGSEQKSEQIEAALADAFASQGKQWWRQKRDFILDTLAVEVRRAAGLQFRPSSPPIMN